MILFSAAPPSPSFSAPPLRIPVAQSPPLGLGKRPLPLFIYMPRTPNAPSGMERSRRQNNRRAQTPPPQTSDLTVTHTSTRSLPAFSQGMAVMQNQGAAGTPHPLFPGFPSRSPSLQTLPLEDSRCHSLGSSAVASVLAPCLQRSTPCQLLPCGTQISKMHGASSSKLFWVPSSSPTALKMSQHRSLAQHRRPFPSWPSWFSPSPSHTPTSCLHGARSSFWNVSGHKIVPLNIILSP